MLNACKRSLSAALLILASICLCVTGLEARGVSYMGTDFWFGFMPNAKSENTTLELYLASPSNATVTIEMYGGGEGEITTTNTITLKAKEAQVVNLDVFTALTRNLESGTYQAIHVKSTAPTSVYAYSFDATTNGNSSDAFLVLPTIALDTSYIISSYFDDDYGQGKEKYAGEFLIVAPYDNTRVTITTKATTRNLPNGNASHNADEPWDVVLKKGQTYLVQSRGTNANVDDISGSMVSSDKPIAVISGHQRTKIAEDIESSSKSHLAEMLLPVRRLSTRYNLLPMPNRTVIGDVMRFYATAANSRISFWTGGSPYNLALPGDYATKYGITTPETYFPGGFGGGGQRGFQAMRYIYSKGVLGDTVNARPAMSQLVAQSQWLTFYSFVTPHKHGDNPLTHYVTIVGDSNSIKNDLIKLNGKALSTYPGYKTEKFLGVEPEMVPSLYTAARIFLPEGVNYYEATGPTPFTVDLVGFSDDDGYAMPGGMAVNILSTETVKPRAKVNTASCGTYNLSIHDTARVQSGPGFQVNSKLAIVELITESGDPRSAKASSNYKISFTKAFSVGDSITNVIVQPIDPNKPGYAALYVQDLAGNDTVLEFANEALTSNPVITSSIDFGQVPLNTTSCKTIWLKNTTSADVTITSLTIVHKGAGGTFTTNPPSLSTTLKPGDSTSVEICFNASVTGLAADSLYIGTNCSPIGYALEARGTTLGVTPADLERPSGIVSFNAIVPNPASSSTKIGYSVNADQAKVSIEVYNTLGQRVLEVMSEQLHHKGNYTQTVDLSTLPAGKYTVRIATPHGVASRSVMVRR